MKLKSLIIVLLLALCAGGGYFLYNKFHRSSAAAGEADEADTGPTVVTVQTGVLQRMTLHQYVTGYGTVAPAPAMPHQPAAAAPVAAAVAGVVTKVDVVEGQQVKAGQVLVELNSAAMTESYAEAEVARLQQLYSQHNTSLKNLQNAEAQLALLRVTAPLAGTIVRLNAKPGAAVDVNMVVAEIMDLNRLVVQSAIPATQASAVNPGQPIQVLTSPPVTANLTYVSPTVDTNADTVMVWAALPSGSGLRPGQFVPIRIVTAVHTNCLAAPAASVVTDVKGQSTLSLVHGNEATRTAVQAGVRDHGWVEVTGPGLEAGAAVVTVGAYGLPAKTQIRIVKP